MVIQNPHMDLYGNLKNNLVSQIKDCILGRQKTAFGYKWKYK